MKKESLFFILVIVIGSIIQSFAQATLTIPTDVPGTPGNAVTVPVNAKGVTNLVGFQFTVDYDISKLTFVNSSNWATGISGVTVSTPQEGKITFVYADPGFKINMADGKFFEINFTVKEEASGSALLNWSDSPTARSLVNYDLEEISCNYIGGNVKIQSVCTAPVSPTIASASQTTISAGQSTTLQVNGGALNSAPNWIWYIGGCGENQIGIGSTLSVSPTSTTTYYVQAKACGTSTTCRSVTITVNNTSPGLSVNPGTISFGNVEINMNSASKSYSLTGSNLTGNVTVTAPSQFQVSLSSTSGWSGSLTVTPTEGSVSSTIYVRFSPTSTGSETGNITNASTGATTQNVSVSGTGVIPPPILPATLTLPTDIPGTPGNAVTVHVNAKEINSLVGFQFTVDYDISKLTFINASNWATGISGVTVSTPQEGKITFVYADPGFKINMADGKFFEINFTVKEEASGTALFNWSDSPTARSLVNYDLEEINCNYIGGSVKIQTDCTAPVSPTSATATQTTITAGQTTTLQVNGGILNSASDWIWYTGNCGENQVGTGSSLSVSPTSTTTYYAQASACGTLTTCRSVTITVNNPSPTLSVNPTTLNFGIVEIYTSSSAKSYALTGSNITDNITVTAPSQYEVSLNPTSGWAGSVTVTPNSGSVNRTIYVRFIPTSIGSKTGNVSNASSGASTLNVSVSGTGVIPEPTLSVNPATLSFGNVDINTSSSEKSYAITGSNLTGNVTVTAPSHFEVSLSSTSGWASSITVLPVSGGVTRTIYVRFSPTSTGSKTGSVSNASSGAATLNVSVSGTGEEMLINTISQIQGMNSVSPSLGLERTTKGTVTGVLPGVGYFIQDAIGPWSGIWIDDPLTVVFEGNGIEITGVVKELNGVTSIEGKGKLTNPPITIQPISLQSPQQANDEKYESVLVQIKGVRAKSINPNGTWLVYTEVNNTLVIGEWLYNYQPIAGNFYSITGIINGINDLYRLEPRNEGDIIDQTLTTSLSDEKTVGFNIYPNPFDNELIIQNSELLARIIITNTLGQQMMDIKYPKKIISTNELVSGIYIISLFDEYNLVTAKIMIKK